MTCSKCGNKAIGRLSPDLDIEGIGFCEEHEEVVRLAYFLLLTGDIETDKEFKDILKN